jgi:ketosteroid isomerase-like protein
VDRAIRDYADPGFEMHLPSDYPEGSQVLRGREGMAAFGAVLREAWREWRIVPKRFLDAGDQVVVFALLVAVGHESGVPIELATNHVWTIRDGRATSLRVYRDRSEALAAAGLRE